MVHGEMGLSEVGQCGMGPALFDRTVPTFLKPTFMTSPVNGRTLRLPFVLHNDYFCHILMCITRLTYCLWGFMNLNYLSVKPGLRRFSGEISGLQDFQKKQTRGQRSHAGQ